MNEEQANHFASKDNPQHTDLLDNLQKILLKYAHGMFRWVQIWLEIFLPALDERNTIRKRDTATKLFDQLQDDVTHKYDAYQPLESGYQRLWDLNYITEYQDQRVRLFQIVLGSFRPQSPESIREALRIRDDTYDQDLTTKEVTRLCSNFLYEDRGELRFVHESARRFILSMKPTGGSGNDVEAQFSKRKNHLAIANLYMDLVGLSTHPFWQAQGLEPSNWTEFTTSLLKADRLRQDQNKWREQPNSFHVYLARHGLQHCAVAARKRSMFDAVWSDVLDRLILDPHSAFGFTILVDEKPFIPKEADFLMMSREFRLCLLGQSEGRISLFPSHFLALLNIIHEDDVSRLSLNTEMPCGTLEEDRQRRLFKHAACVGGDFTNPLKSFNSKGTATALYLACGYLNKAAVGMILQATKCLSSNSAKSILFTKCHILPMKYDEYIISDYPIAIAIYKYGNQLTKFEIVETLLKFERYHSSGLGSQHSATELYISKQWSLVVSPWSEPALHLAAGHFEEDQMRHLLSVARPEDINIRDQDGFTVLHLAAMRGFLRLAEELVDNYGADIEAKSNDGRTPSFIAFKLHKTSLLEFFKSRGANVDFKNFNKPPLPLSPRPRD